MNDSMPFVNPEPPPEIVQIKQEDLIGNTLFSKHWLCEFLLKLIKKIEEDDSKETKAKKDNECQMMEDANDQSINEFKELNADFEKDLCDLWDMSVEYEVCLVLDELNAIQIFEGFIKKYDQTYPRAIEILIGILYNMVTQSDTICLKLVKSKRFIQYLLNNVLGLMSDVPTVIQTIRFFSLFLTVSQKSETNANESSARGLANELFIDCMKNELKAGVNNTDIENDQLTETTIVTNGLDSSNRQSIKEKIYFILENSLNPTLLDSTIYFLLSLLDSDDEILNNLVADDRIIDSICNAAHTRSRIDQIPNSATNCQFTTSRRDHLDRSVFKEPTTNNSNDFTTTPRVPPTNDVTSLAFKLSAEEDISSIDYLFNKYFLCLQTISTCESGIISILSKFECIIQLFSEYLDKCLLTFNDWEIRSSNSLRTSVIEESLQNFVCLLSVLNCIFSNQQTDLESSTEYDFSITPFLIKLFTFCKYYLNLFKDRQMETSQLPSKSNSSDNFQLIKSNVQELCACVTNLKYENNSNLKNLYQDCVSLIK